MGWKSNINIYFSKQILLFHLFLPFILRYVKNVLDFFIYQFFHSIYVFNIYQDYFRMLRKLYYGGIFNFLTLKICGIDILQTCNICRTAELEIPIPTTLFFFFFFFALVLQTTS